MREFAPQRRRDDGFTLIELMVAMTLFLVLGAVVLSAVITMSKALDHERVTGDITAEARVALERMAREIRQADYVLGRSTGCMICGFSLISTATRITGPARVAMGLRTPRYITYAYDKTNESIAMRADGFGEESLLAGHVKGFTFTYFSSDWSKDTDQNGIVTLDEAGTVGVDRVVIDLTVESRGQEDEFRTQVTLRNGSQS